MSDPVEQHRELIERLVALERALDENEERFREFFERNSAVMLLIEPDGGEILDANDAASLYYGYSLQCLIGMNINAINMLNRKELALELRRAMQQERNFFRFRHRLASGEVRHVEVCSTPLKMQEGSVLLSVVHDVTDHERNEAALRRERQRLHNLLLASRAGTWEWNYQSGETLYNKRWYEILGDSEKSLGSRSPLEWGQLIHPADRDYVRRAIRNYLSGQTEVYECEIRMRHRDGHWVWVQVRGEIAERTPEGAPLWIVGTLLDISQRKLYEQQLERIAHYDALTGLPNRLLLSDRLEMAMRQVKRRQRLIGLVYLDLDGFKAINDRHGHDMGDRLLVEVSNRLRQALREGDTLARLGGDEFVAVLVDLAGRESTLPLLKRMRDAVAQPCEVEGVRLQVSASLGVSFYPQAEPLEPDQLLRQADQAMYQAKLAGKNRYEFFDAEQDRSVRGFHEHLERIGQALMREEFVLHFQPKVDMGTGTLLGAEALIRWQHPERGLLAPAAFLPQVENQPLGITLGEWVMESALEQLRRWQAQGLGVPVSVNLSASQLLHPEFLQRLQGLLQRFPDVPPGWLELEILESSAVHDFERARAVVSFCHRLGVRVALDDFGIGYSSLSYLRRLPVHGLKIDRSFVQEMQHDPEDLAILEGILGMADAFRLEVVAEGVESREHGELLLQLGCRLGQGFHIARPMPGDALPGWARSWEPDPAWSGQVRLPLEKRPLLRAIVEHRGWCRAVSEYCQGRREEPPTLEVDNCGFGRWLLSEGRHCLPLEVLERLHQIHERIHECAADMLQQVEAGDHDGCAARLEPLNGFCTELVALLEGELRRSGLSSLRQGRGDIAAAGDVPAPPPALDH